MPADHDRTPGQAALRLPPVRRRGNQSAAEGPDLERRPRSRRAGVVHVAAAGLRSRSPIADVALEHARLESA
ncbi:hypothetical protein G6F23_016019 [Rhizopus arrhizus]|nr:hypothetical protein G6F23_016019 [Rhizopus arrhizus]